MINMRSELPRVSAKATENGFHLKEKDWYVRCEYCGKEFQKKAYLRTHLSRSHADVGAEQGLLELLERNPNFH